MNRILIILFLFISIIANAQLTVNEYIKDFDLNKESKSEENKGENISKSAPDPIKIKKSKLVEQIRTNKELYDVDDNTYGQLETLNLERLQAIIETKKKKRIFTPDFSPGKI